MTTRRFLLIFATGVIGSSCVHELGHAVAGWVQGINVIPTPFKEYILQEQIEWPRYGWIAFGGVAGSVIAALATIAWYAQTDSPGADPVLAGVLLTPFFYTIRYLLAGRGHDGLEWQAAQSVAHVAPTGHVVDLLLLALALAGVVVWVSRRRASLRAMSFASAGGLLAFGISLVVICQLGNNALFDGAFPKVRIVSVPPDVQANSDQK